MDAYARFGDTAMMSGLKQAIDETAKALRNRRVRLSAEFEGYSGTKSEREYLEGLKEEVAGYLKEKYNIELIGFTSRFKDAGVKGAPPRISISFFIDERLALPVRTAKVKKPPSSPEVESLNREGADLFKKGDIDGAVKVFDKALEIEPANQDVRFNRAVALQKKGQLKAAEEEYLKLQKVEETERVNLMLGMLYQQKAEPDKAVLLYEKVLRSAPDNRVARKRLTELRPDLKPAAVGDAPLKESRAVVPPKKVREKRDGSKRSLTAQELKSREHNRAGIDAYLKGDYARAFAEFIDAVILDPENIQARFNLGVAYQLRERYGEAIVEFQKVLQMEDVPRAHVMLGATYVMQGRYKDAVEELENVVFFDFDSWRISPEGVRAIGEFAKIMKGGGEDYPVRLDGHTDSTGPSEYNEVLSRKRAIAVALEMVVMNQVKPESIFISGRGEDEPLATNAKNAGRRLNRRVEMLAPGLGGLH